MTFLRQIAAPPVLALVAAGLLVTACGGEQRRAECPEQSGATSKSTARADTDESDAADPESDSAATVDRLSIPPLPGWTDKYAASNEGDMRFFAISKLQTELGLSWLRAVELQNAYRDLSRANPTAGPATLFEQALASIRAGELESGLDDATLEQAAFIVVVDLDDTLYDQYYDDAVAERCHDVVAQDGDGERREIKLAPGWDAFVAEVRRLGGTLVIFSANRDDTVLENLAAIELDGTPLNEHPAVAGILTNSHLVLQSTFERVPEGRRGDPVVIPSKDLRVLDPDLDRVVLVDDNPTRVVQHSRMRLVKKFDADLWCTTDPDSPARAALDRQLAAVVAEIEESLEYQRSVENDVSFATAYAPYTMLGRVLVGALVQSGMSPSDARRAVREEPAWVDDEF